MPNIEIAPGVEVQVSESGVLQMGTVPESLRAVIQNEFDRAFSKGRMKAGEEAKTQMEAEVARVREEAKKSAGDPVLAERAKTLELELSQFKEAEATRNKNFEEAQRIREERHAKEIEDRENRLKSAQTEIERRTSRISELVTADIRLAAQKHGAREQSLAELDMLLRGKIALDKDLQAYVKDEKDPEKPAQGTDGKPVTIDGLVQQYLTDHPHHKAAPGGRGGGAAGGSSLAGNKGNVTEFAQAVERTAQNPTVANVADAIGKIRSAQKAS
jgi:small-conductance mechanosensitive channel